MGEKMDEKYENMSYFEDDEDSFDDSNYYDYEDEY
jgi:hypothetical protein